jgi:hypothetical protein
MAQHKQQIEPTGLSAEELDAQQAADLPDREAMSLLDLDVNLDLALDLAAPIDAAVAANANAAIPLDAAVAANVLSANSVAVAFATPSSDWVIGASWSAEATATELADSTLAPTAASSGMAALALAATAASIGAARSSARSRFTSRSSNDMASRSGKFAACCSFSSSALNPAGSICCSC